MRPSLEGLEAWLEEQPSDGEYVYQSTLRCLVGQYLDYIGVDYMGVGDSYYVVTNPNIVKVPLHAAQQIAVQEPHTFGAALERTRHYLTRTRKAEF